MTMKDSEKCFLYVWHCVCWGGGGGGGRELPPLQHNQGPGTGIARSHYLTCLKPPISEKKNIYPLSPVLVTINNYKKIIIKHPLSRVFSGNLPETTPQIFPYQEKMGTRMPPPICIRVGGEGAFTRLGYRQLREGRYCSAKMFRWEPEGRYHCTKSVAIAPFWFSYPWEHIILICACKINL